MAAAKKRKDTGRYRGRYRGPDGREHTKDFDRKVDADNWIINQRNSMIQGNWVDPSAGRITVGDWAVKWLKTKESLKPSSYANYEELWRNLVKPRWEDVSINRVAHEDVADWVVDLSARGLSGSRIRQAHGVLYGLLEFAVKAKRLSVNHAADVDLPSKASKEKRFLTAAQVQTLATEIGEQYAPFIYFLAYTGCRWGEATRLTVNRLDLLRARAFIAVAWARVNGRYVDGTPKNHERRHVPMPRFLVELLTETVAGKTPGALVFTTASGAPITASNFRRNFFDPAATAAGAEGLTPHELRHTAASLAIASGASIKAVQKMLGHKSATMTLDLYGHLYPDEMDALAGALDKVAEEARRSQTTADVRQLKEKQ